MGDKFLNLKNELKNKLIERLPIIFIVIISILFTYSFIKESITVNIQTGAAIPNSIVNSIVVALDSTVNPNGIIAAAVDISEKVQNGEGIIVKDVFDRCVIQSDNRVSDGFYQPFDTKAGVNNGDPIGDGNGGDEIRKYLRYDNRSSLDLEASQNVVILMKGTGPTVLASAIRNINEKGMIPIIRLGVIDMGDYPFQLTEDASEMVNYFTQVGDELMRENKGWKAVLSLGPNEPTTGGAGEGNIQVMGIPDYQTMVQRENQAADQLQKYRVVNGGPFWLAPAIFNGTASYQANGREYSQDVYRHLYIDGEDTSTEKDYWKRKSIDPDLFDVMLANIYMNVAKPAYNFYKEFGLKEYVDKRPGLVTIVTEFGIDPFSPSLVTADLKPDFKAFYEDPKVEGINWFRALKDKPAPAPAPSPEQSATLEDFIKFLEQSGKTAKKISLKNFSWVNCALGTTIERTSTSSSGSSSGTLNPTTKGGLNEGENAPGGGATMDTAKSYGLAGYSLAIINNPGDSAAAIQFISESISKGFTPIIRLCVNVSGSCGFNLSGGRADDLVSFYNAVSQGASGSFIGIVGPNEPSTEWGVFNASSMDEVKRAAVTAAKTINKNGKMLIGTPAFNLQTQDLTQFKSAFGEAKFDVLIGNAYNIGTAKADEIAGEAISTSKANGLKFILTETGAIKGAAEDFEITIGRLCSQVDGFMLFRSQESSPGGNYENVPQPFGPEKLKAIAAACSGSNPTSSNDSNSNDSRDDSSNSAVQCTSGVADDQIIFLGDSLTNELVAKQFPGSKNLGFPGASTEWLVPGSEPANDKSDQLNTALNDPKYKAIVIEFGTNDCGGVDVGRFKQNLTTIINNIKNVNAEVDIILSTIPRAHKACSSSTIDSFNAAINEVRSSTGVLGRELGGSLFDESDLRSGDDRHLTDEAYAEIAQITKEALGGVCVGSNTGTTTETTLGAGSLALSCGVEEDKPAEFYKGKNAAALRVRCAGGSCTTKMVGTIEIEAPTKLFSTNTPNGTMRLRYVPVSQVAASQSKTDGYDGLNMFAGEIKIGSDSYPLPGLGSAINSATEILEETMTSGDPKRFSTPSGQSLLKWTRNKLEIQSQQGKTIGVVGEKNVGGFTTNAFSIQEKEGNSLESINERAVTYDGLTFNNDAGLADWRKNLMPYDPSIAFPTYIAPKACQQSEMKFINNLDNYVTGPELVVEEEKTVTTNTTQQICWMYAGRSIPGRTPYMSGDGVKTCGYIFDTRIFSDANIDAISPRKGKPLHRIYETVYNELLGTYVTTSRIEEGNWTCQELFTGQANGTDGVDEDAEFKNVEAPKVLPNCDFDDYYFELYKGKLSDAPGNPARSGRCDIPADLVSCLRYDAQDSDEVYIHTEKYPIASKVKIPKIYSALYGLYDRLQTMMSNRNMKMVFRENIGMKFKVNSKIRDANESISAVQYDFSTQYDNYYQPELIDNTLPLASNNPTKTQFQYFDDLGYLDILQEYTVAYANEQAIIGDHVMDNPFVEKGIFNPLQDRTKIVAGGESNLSLANPILTCDQVEICKNYTYTELETTFGPTMALRLCPLTEKLPVDAKKNCITNISDDRFIDRLNTTLCARGFNVDENCHFQCSVSGQGGNNSGGNGTTPVIINGTYSTLFPVSKSRQIPNCTEPASVQVVNTDRPVQNDEGMTSISLIPVAKQALEQMMAAMKQNDPSTYAKCGFAYGYRSAEMQGTYTCGSGTACKCHSEHQLGTTVDFRNAEDMSAANKFNGSACSNWLRSNAANYGFIQSYTGADPDYVAESWHYRYIGIEEAQKFKAQSQYTYLRAYLESIQSGGNSSGNGNTSNIPGDFKVRYPTEFDTLTGNYGTKGGYATHTGVDIRVSGVGGTIFAAESGTVLYAGPDNENNANYTCVTDSNNNKYSPLCQQLGLSNIGAYGFMVKILHPNGKVTLYAHNSDLKVKTGDCVNKGDLIALAGSVGNSTGPHSHFEIRKNSSCSWDGNSLGVCTEPPEDYLVPGGGNTSVFTSDQIKSVCNGVLPPTDPGTGDGDEIVCRPTGEDEIPTDDNPKQTPGGALCLIKKAADSLTANGIPTNPYMMYAILHQETQSLLDPLAGKNDFICPTTWDDWALNIGNLSSLPKCTGDPNQKAFASFNRSNPPNIDVRGLTQFYSATFNGIINNYDSVMTNCINDLGVDNTIANSIWLDPLSSQPGKFSRHRVGDAICAQAVKLMNDARTANGGTYLSVEEWLSNPEIIRQTACTYYGACQDNYEVNVLRYFNEAVQAKVFDNLDCSGNSTGPDPSGVLSCNVNTSAASTTPDFSKSALSWEAYIRALNLDNNSSYVWFANPNGESDNLKQRLINKLGSESAYQQDYNQRLQVTNAFIDKAKSLGINPQFALTLWFEETEFSAVGKAALGCLYFRNGTQTTDIPRDGNPASQIAHLNQQLECLNTYVDEFTEFRQFMCTYSGEVGRPNCTEFKNNPNFPKNICRYYDWF